MAELQFREEQRTALRLETAAPQRTLRILLVHAGSGEAVTQWHQGVAAQAPPGIEVCCFPLAVPGFKKRIAWETLDLAWRRRHPALLRTYARLREACQEADVLLLYGGYNLHPAALDALPTFNVYCFYDDPESSDKASRHLAPAFDAVFYCNVASRFQYEDWGCRRLAHLPIFTAPRDIPSPLERPKLLTGDRDNDIILCCGWDGGAWRRRRMRRLAEAFPQARCFGKGWPGGFVDDATLRDFYRRSRIGWNVHNSTGPINVRLYALAAWNILQICDNRTGLAEVFDVDREAVGFDTVPEAIEKTRYYLDHEDERRAIARRGHERYWRDYSTEALWRRVARQIDLWRRSADTPRARRRASALPAAARLGVGYRLGAGWLSLQRTEARLQRSRLKRSELETWPIDERAYLGTPVAYDPATPFEPRPRLCAQRPPGRRPDLEDRALAWAVTGLIGPDASVVLSGDGPLDDQRALLERVPGRTVLDDEGTAPDGTITRIHWGVPPTEETVSPLTVVLRAEQVAVLGGCNAAHARLAKGGTEVALYWLPNPVVPWLEPLPGPLEGVALIARRRQRHTSAPREHPS